MSHQVIQRPPIEAAPLQRDAYHGTYASFLGGPSPFTLPRRRHATPPSRSALRAPHQYALPVHRDSYLAPSGAGDASSTPSSSHRTEHILRRKTPSGTLAAGYDGTAIEWTSRPHAVKHMLLPLPEKTGPPRPQARASARLSPAAVDAGSAYRPSRPAAPEVVAYGDAPTAPPAFPAGLGPVLQYPRGIDSLINQGAMLQASTYYAPHAAPMPTILQPLHQPDPGPTSSNSEGPFGPYWPDGAFIPYRPAALRDARYHAGYGTVGWTEASSGLHAGFGAPPGALAGTIVPTPDGMAAAAATALDPTVTSMRPSSTLRTYSVPSGHTATGGVPTQGAHRLDQRPSHMVHPAGHSSSAARPCLHRENSTYVAHDLTTATEPSTDPSGSTLNVVEPQLLLHGSIGRPGTHQFKDKLLAWAHGVYVELLTSLHQMRGAAPRNPADVDQDPPRLPKPSIYPKPPRQPSLSLPLSHGDVGSAGVDDALDARRTRDESRGDHHHSQPGEYRGDGQRRRGQTRAEPASQRPGPHIDSITWPGVSHRLERRSSSDASHPAAPVQALPLSSGYAEPRIGRSSFGTSDSRCCICRGASFVLLTPIAATVQANARTALELIARLCAESSWAWIDGMLLAGCLAYGLGNYQEALSWYSKILEIDAKLVAPCREKSSALYADEYLSAQPRRGHLESGRNPALPAPTGGGGTILAPLGQATAELF